jgi:SHS2 domain-containing protein
MPGHTFVAHTSEVQVHLEGATLADLLLEAGGALAELQLGPLPPGPIGPPQTLRVQASDREALLVEWLNELIYRSEVGKCVFTELAITRASDRELTATVRGYPAESLRTQPKAATLHGLAIRKDGAGLSADVVIDV